MPQQTAGTEVYTWSLANELLKKGAEITVVIPNYGNQESIEYMKMFEPDEYHYL